MSGISQYDYHLTFDIQQNQVWQLDAYNVRECRMIW